MSKETRNPTKRLYTIDEIKSIFMPYFASYGITDVWLIGSYADGTATIKSDIDLIYDYKDLFNVADPNDKFLEMVLGLFDLVNCFVDAYSLKEIKIFAHKLYNDLDNIAIKL